MTIPMTFIAVAVLMVGLSIPLILRKVRMNHIYGVRFPQSFKSDKNWCYINAAGGKIMVLWSVPIFALGAYGLVYPSAIESTYIGNGGFITLASMIGMVLHGYFAAKRIDKKNAQQEARGNGDS